MGMRHLVCKTAPNVKHSTPVQNIHLYDKDKIALILKCFTIGYFPFNTRLFEVSVNQLLYYLLHKL